MAYMSTLILDTCKEVVCFLPSYIELSWFVNTCNDKYILMLKRLKRDLRGKTKRIYIGFVIYTVAINIDSTYEQLIKLKIHESLDINTHSLDIVVRTLFENKIFDLFDLKLGKIYHTKIIEKLIKNYEFKI